MAATAPAGKPLAVLVGPMGVGKTTTGHALAQRLQAPFVDTDLEIERAAQCSIGELFTRYGEVAFRELERDVIAYQLQREGIVLSLGGGAVTTPATVENLVGHRVIFLDVDLEHGRSRVGSGTGRPLLAAGEHAWAQIFTSRRPLYEAVATYTFDTSDLTPDTVCDAIMAAMDGPSSATS